MARVISAFKQFFDDTGNPLVNGWLRFTESGTNSTDKDTFADGTETIPNTNPVQLDGAGRCPNVFGSGSYRVTSFKDDGLGNPGTQIQQFDPVGGSIGVASFDSWNAESIFAVGDIITASNGLYYKSINSGNQGNDPTTSPADWEQIKFFGVYNASVTYALGDVIQDSTGFLWKSMQNSNTGNPPGSSPTYWDTPLDVTAEIAAVAGIIPEITAVAGITTEVVTVAGISSEVVTVAGDSAAIATVNANSANINTVAGVSTDVTTVAGVATDVPTVAGVATDVPTVAGVSADVTTVAGISSDVSTVAGVSADVSTVAGISTDVSTVATNVADVTNFSDVYQGGKAADPTLRNDGSALQNGDLYFNTALSLMRVYDLGSTTWISLSGTLNSIVEDTTPQLGGTLDTNGKLVQLSKGADVASATALTLGSDGNYFDVTGTTTIASINTTGKVGTVIKLHFDGVLTLTHHATDLILPGGANITTAAGDEAEFVEYASGDFRCTKYSKADGTSVVSAGDGNGTLNAQTFTSSGTWIKPDGVENIHYFLVGGGGAGGGCAGSVLREVGGGGGGGEVVEGRASVTGNVTVTIGSGGSGVSGGKGSDGGNSQISGGVSTTTAVGGGGGEASGSASFSGGHDKNRGGAGENTTSSSKYLFGGCGAGAGGSAGLGIVIPSDTTTDLPPTYSIGSSSTGVYHNPSSSQVVSSTDRCPGRHGGAGVKGYGGGGAGGSYFGGGFASDGGATALTNTEGNGTSAPANKGGGGGGAITVSTTTRTGGNGGSGICIITWWEA